MTSAAPASPMVQEREAAGSVANPAAAAAGAASKSHASGNDGGNISQFSYFAILFYLLLEAMEVRQSTVMSQSKMIAANAAAQNRLNKENANIKFSILPYNAKTATINRVQDENQEYAAQRENIQNSLITLRQNAQVQMTQASTNVNILEQDASENSGWLKMLATIFKVIDQITQR